ncbi:hypothetical protein ACHAWF_012980 [Thalassiosira exigua]
MRMRCEQSLDVKHVTGSRQRALARTLMICSIGFMEMRRQFISMPARMFSARLTGNTPEHDIFHEKGIPEKSTFNEKGGNGNDLSTSEDVFHEENLPGRSTSNEKRGKGNDFFHHIEDALANEPTSGASSGDKFAALVVRGDRLYCRKSSMKSFWSRSRGRYFVQMLRHGLMQRNPQTEPGIISSYPILLKLDDSNGCNSAENRDNYSFPRLTWSIPANETSNWCAAIGMPSYKIWRDAKKKGKIAQTDNGANFPWSTKLSKAVWRGSTTADKRMYGYLPLEDIPRSKLVRSSLERPDLIDAGFHKFVGKYEAILDIDGNNWSARFHTLLCSNSVVIKIRPDFIEQFYHELEPNVHYIPASLENLTDVVEYVLDSRHDAEMQSIVRKANQWCQGSISKGKLASMAVAALETYRNALEEHTVAHWMDWQSRSPLKNMDDMVECRV